MHPAIFKIPESAPAPSFSLKKILFDAQCFHLVHPGFKNGTMLPFVHPLLLFSLQCVVLRRILFNSLQSVWFGEQLGSVKVKVLVFSVAVVVYAVLGFHFGVPQIVRIKLICKKFTN